MKLRKNVLQSITYHDQQLVESFSTSQRQLQQSIIALLNACKAPEEIGIASNSKCEPAQTKENVSIAFEVSRNLAQLPIALLKEYESIRQESLLGRIFVRANEFHALVDRVVILAPHSIALAIEAIQAACVQPHWNELTRAARGSKPRLNLISDRLDNDSIQGVLEILGAHQDIHVSEVNDRWGVLLVVPDAASPLVHLFANYFLPALKRQLAASPELFKRCVVTVVPELACRESSLGAMLEEHDLQIDFSLAQLSAPSGRLLEPSGIFSEAALLPAALLGVNVMEFVAGAASLSLEGHRLSQAFPDKVIALTSANFAWHSGTIDLFTNNVSRHLKCHADSLMAFRRWYENQIEHHQQKLLERQAEAFASKQPDAPSPKSAHNIPHPIVHQILTRQWRFDELQATSLPQDMPATLPGLIQQSANSFHAQCIARNVPISQTQLPIVDELHSGYLFQWLLIASTLERELLALQPNSNLQSVC